MKVPLKSAAVVALALVPWGCAQSAAMPNAVQALAHDLKGLGFDETRALVLGRFGSPDRDVGSGEVIEQWDALDGTLTLSGLGLVFTKAGASARLTQTTNLVGDCLMGTYEMTTIPTDSLPSYWMGNVDVGNDGHYRYKESGTNLDRRAEQASNYFMLHPIGAVRVTYSEGVGPTTRVESLRVGQPVATLTLLANESATSRVVVVASAPETMQLVVESSEPPFRMSKGWMSHWPVK